MKESQFGFQYSWSDLQPIRALSITVVAVQVAGLLLGAAFPRFPNWFESMWLGGAIATFLRIYLASSSKLVIAQAAWLPIESWFEGLASSPPCSVWLLWQCRCSASAGEA